MVDAQKDRMADALIEAQAEIARLQAALARTEQNRDDILNDLHTAWNDAIEAAAQAADDCRKCTFTAGMGMRPVLEAIRALRKETK